MVEIELTPEALVVHVKGMDKLWAMKSSLSIPIEHVASVELGVTPQASQLLKGSIRVGTSLGEIVAGRFYREGKIAFWDVHDWDKAITIRVVHDDYTHLVVEVADPSATAEQIRTHIGGTSPLPPATVVQR